MTGELRNRPSANREAESVQKETTLRGQQLRNKRLHLRRRFVDASLRPSKSWCKQEGEKEETAN